jgi:hypothetical protein
LALPERPIINHKVFKENLNPEGEMVGFYFDQAGNKHGFVFGKENYVSFDITGATGTAGGGIDAQETWSDNIQRPSRVSLGKRQVDWRTLETHL